tara:strand:- start:934 stop:1347 length:414 start_codon:yes stop_codon:yes gene_type:complete
MQSIFSNEHSESPAAILRKTMSVSLSEDGTPMVSFALNRGKGSGRQSMPVTEFAAYVSALEEAVESGLSDETEENLTAADMVRRTIQQDDGVISFRVRGGKGAKPAKLPADSFGEVVELLSSTVDAVESAAEKIATS